MKKIISIFLIVSVIFSFYATCTLAETNTAEISGDYSGDYEFCLRLGIIPESLEPKSPIKRIELAQIFANIIMYGTEL